MGNNEKFSLVVAWSYAILFRDWLYSLAMVSSTYGFCTVDAIHRAISEEFSPTHEICKDVPKVGILLWRFV